MIYYIENRDDNFYPESKARYKRILSYPMFHFQKIQQNFFSTKENNTLPLSYDVDMKVSYETYKG